MPFVTEMQFTATATSYLTPNLQALALAAPAETMAALRPAAEAALTGKPQDADRPATLAAAEILSGLLASGAPFAGTFVTGSFFSSIPRCFEVDWFCCGCEAS